MKELRQANPWLGAFGLSDDDFYQVIVLSTRAVIESDSLEVFCQKISDLVKGDQQILKKIVEAVVNNRFLPFKDEITGFAEFAKKIGWQAPAPVLPKESPEELVKRILAENKISFPDYIEQSRLEFILTSMVKGERAEVETKAALMRDKKVGGLEFEDADADNLLTVFKGKYTVQPKMMTDIRKPEVTPDRPSSTPTLPHPPSPGFGGTRRGRENQVVSPQAASAPILKTPPTPSSPYAPLTPTTPPIFPLGKDLEEDEKEIIKAAALLKEKISPVVRPVASVEEAVQRIESESGLKLDENGRKKFLTIVEARLKEVRDAFETRDALERPAEQGGFGIKGGLLASVMEALEKIVSEQQTSSMADFNKAKQAAREAKAAEEAEKKQAAIAAARAARPKVVLRPAVPVMSPASQTAATARPVMTDVVAPPRKLSGPIDELSSLTVDDFRRLSREPKEAAIKIKDKISLLEEQGIGQKILGVKAWHASPINRLYLEISRAALVSGRTIEDISNERLKNGQISLSLEEVKIINELNGELRF